MKWVARFTLIFIAAVGMAVMLNPRDRSWELAKVGADYRLFKKAVGRGPDAFDGDDVFYYLSRNGKLTFPLFSRVLRVRINGCSNCGDDVYIIVSSDEAWWYLFFFGTKYTQDDL